MTSTTGAPEAFIYDAVRTPRGKGKPGGSLHTVKPVNLLSGLIEAIMERNPGINPDQISDIIAGCVTPVGDQGMDIARTAALNASLPYTATGVQVNRYCASGLTAVNLAAQKIRSGWDDLVFAGGVESMSRVPMGSDGGALALDPESNFHNDFIPQGISADIIASLDGLTREDVDTFAARSHERASQAWEEGRFDRTVIPVKDQNGITLLERDETIRPGTTVEGLSGLRPAFATIGDQGGFDAVAQTKYPQLEKINHLHHAGNSSGIVDGAALLAIGSEKAGKDFGLEPRARIVSVATSGVEPTIMLTAPAPASRAALAKAGLKPEDIDIWEINEAFSSVVLRAQRELHIPDEKLNVSGGAIAMGHPLGATGAIITGTAVDELHRTGGRYGLITLCVAAGMGVATIIERV